MNVSEGHKRQSSKVCGQVISYLRNHGTSNWVLNNQWSGDCVLCCQVHPSSCEKTSCKKIRPFFNQDLNMFSFLVYLFVALDINITQFVVSCNQTLNLIFQEMHLLMK